MPNPTKQSQGTLYDRMLEAALTGLVPGEGSEWIYSSLLELAERQLEDLAAGRNEDVMAWCWHVLQVQIPAVRQEAGIVLNPPLESEREPYAVREVELRERYGVPAPE